MAEVQFTFRGVTFNNDTDITGGIYMLYNIPEGLKSPNIQHSEASLQNRHGILDGISFYTKRVISFQGKIIASTQATRKTMEEVLKGIFTLDGVQTEDEPSYYTLYMTDEDASTKQMNVKINRAVEFSKEALVPNIRDFIVEFKAKDPVWYSQTLHSQTVDQGVESSALELPTELPVMLGSSFINEATINNAGTFRTYPIITITGVGENPTIENVTTDESMTIEVTMVDGDELIIDCQNGTVTLNGADALAYLGSSSRFISLASGDNTIRLVDDSDASLDLQAVFEWRDAWI